MLLLKREKDGHKSLGELTRQCDVAVNMKSVTAEMYQCISQCVEILERRVEKFFVHLRLDKHSSVGLSESGPTDLWRERSGPASILEEGTSQEGKHRCWCILDPAKAKACKVKPNQKRLWGASMTDIQYKIISIV